MSAHFVAESHFSMPFLAQNNIDTVPQGLLYVFPDLNPHEHFDISLVELTMRKKDHARSANNLDP